MNSQTKVIVLTALALATVDIGVRGGWFARTPPVLTCSESAGVVTAREFRLVDASGNLRAHLYTDESGEPGLVLYDRTGARRAQFDTFDSVPSVILNAPDERHSAYFGMDRQGQSVLSMYDENGAQMAAMDTTGTQPVFWTNSDSIFNK